MRDVADPAAPAGGVHPLDEAVQLTALDAGRYRGAPSQKYWNMAGPFGGVTASVLLNAVLSDPAMTGRPLAQTVNFCAAIKPEPFEVAVTLERGGKSTQHWNAAIIQNDAVVANCTAVTGPDRETWAHQPATPPEPRSAPASQRAPGQSALGWIANYEMQFEDGSPGFGQSEPAPDGVTRLWLRDWPERPLDFVALAALADAFAPRVFVMRGLRSPAATVTLTTYFLASADDLARQGARPLYGVAQPRAVKGGFHDQTVELWSAARSLLAVSHQLVWFKE